MPYSNPERRVLYQREYRKKHYAKLSGRSRRFYQEHPERAALYEWRGRMKDKYGLTEKLFDELVCAQNNRCAICGSEGRLGPSKKSTLCVDHDHTAGVIRGLLCSQCNSGIGMLRDDVELVNKALIYLRAAQCGATYRATENSVVTVNA